MKIGIIYIATGRYICFWKEFYESAKQFLFPNDSKEFFVITDNEDFEYKNNDDVKTFYYPKKKWPDAALLKYETILTAKNDILSCDYAFYFNANMKFVDVVDHEILPDEAHENLAICIWASYFNNKNVNEYPYDRNPECQACIKENEGKYYLMGGLHGGKSEDYIKMCEELDKITKEDMAKGIVAKFHDESYINKYMLDKNPLYIEPNYAMPISWKIKGVGKNKAVILKKNHYKYGGHAYLRGETDKKITPLKYWLNKVFKLNLK